MRDASIEQQAGAIEPSRVREAWTTPSLRVLGTLAELTASGSKNGRENGKGNPLKNRA